jgi:Ca-activated chloride channel family protein
VEPVTFASPVFLIGLALIPVALVLYVRSQRRSQAFASAPLLPSVVRRRVGWRRHAAVAGYGIAGAALLVALAKPQATIAVPAEQARVMIVTDHSGSMMATDVKPSRLAAAKEAAGTFLDALPDKVKAGAVAFNNKADVLQSPTTDHAAVKEAIDAIKPAGGTATGDAITATLNALGGKAPAAIVLLSDGESVRGSDPLEAAQAAKERKIPIYTVALGTAEGTIGDGEPVPPDPDTLAKIAQLTGGQAFTAGDLDKLDAVYKRLGSEVATVKKKREVTSEFAAGALALLTLSALGSLGLTGRLI